MKKRSCNSCGASDIKLWRTHGEYFPPLSTHCGPCSVKKYREDHADHVHFELAEDGSHKSAWPWGKREQTWEMGWRVPGVEIADGSGFWSNWSDNPEAIEAWENWKKLPNE